MIEEIIYKEKRKHDRTLESSKNVSYHDTF